VSSKTVAPKNKSTTPVEPEPIKSKKESKTQKSVVAKVTETPKKKVVIIEDDDEDEPSDNITQKSNNTQKKRKAESNNEEPKKKKQKLENEGESKPKILSRRLGKRSGDKVMKYRKKILDAYKKCVVTGNDIEEVNMAVPILDWALIPIDVPISNTGLILRNDWAYLFKKQAWSVDEEHKIVLSHKMKTDNYYSKFEGKSLLLPEDSKWSPDAELLKHQRKLATSKHKK
jgi:hypothetical protein